MRTRSTLLICLLPLAWACGPTEKLASIQTAVIDGSLDNTDAYSGVVLTKQGYAYGTGTLVHPYFVLTAAHALQFDDDIEIFYGLYGYAQGEVVADAKPLVVRDAFAHPKYDPASAYADIALVRLWRPAPAHIPSFSLLPPEHTISEQHLGQDMTVVGYGLTDLSDPDSAGQRRIGGQTLEWLCQQPQGCRLEVHRRQEDDTLKQYEIDVPDHSLCFPHDSGSAIYGDSGGPAFVDVDGEPHVAGVSATNFHTFCSLTGESVYLMNCHTQVDAHWDFLTRTLETFSLELGDECQSHTECLSGHCKQGACEIGPPPERPGCGAFGGQMPGFLAWVVWMGWCWRSKQRSLA